ncbi:DoxX family membrane protein [Leucobacter sp. HY1910]
MMFSLGFLIMSLVLLLVRAMLAVAFAREALLKLKDVPKFAKNDGLPVPLAWVVVVAESAAALSFATGVLAAWAALGVMLLMLGTTALHVFKWRSKYWAQQGGPEYDLLLLTLAAVIAAFGPGLMAVPLPF